MKTHMLFACTFAIISAAEKKPFIPPRSEPIPIPKPKQPLHRNHFTQDSFSPQYSMQDAAPNSAEHSFSSRYFSRHYFSDSDSD